LLFGELAGITGEWRPVSVKNRSGSGFDGEYETPLANWRDWP